MEKIKIGVFGVGRGITVARNLEKCDCKIVAICDNNAERLEWPLQYLGGTATVYTDFDEFIEHDMDAVILANNFHDHAKYTIKCFEKGLHVLCECISNGTMAEGVELIKAYQNSNSIYMLDENFPQMRFNREIKRVCEGGSLGKILYAEGEYNHPVNPQDQKFKKDFIYYDKHWRNYLPATYYLTHSLGPLMCATGATPKRVTAFAAFAPECQDSIILCRNSGDAAGIITTLNDDNSVFRVTGSASFGGHHDSYRVCGTKGQIENIRGEEKVLLRYNSWSKPEGAEETNYYLPEWNDPDEAIIKESGHGGSDYLTVRIFAECIRKGKQPEYPLDLYGAVNMSSVAILAHRSVLEGGKPFDIPDFRNEEDCKKYEEDRLTPFYGADGSEPTLPCSSHPDYTPEKN